MRPETNTSAYYPEPQNTFDFKKFFYRILRKWYWFAISLFIGISAAWLYNRYMPAEFNIRSSVIVNEYESGIKRLSMSRESNNDRNIDVLSQDHAGRLKSHMLSLNTLKGLGWDISWYQKTPLYNKDLYGSEPYKVTLNLSKKNIPDIPVFITEISETEYQVVVEPSKASLAVPVKITLKGKFGELFENSYFNFTLDKIGGRSASGKGIFFLINNLNNLALEYQKKLKVISNEKKPDLIELILSDNNPERGIEFLNMLEQTYIDYGLAEKNRVAENTMKFIDSQLKSVTDSLSNSQSQFTNFRARTQSVDINQEGGMMMQKQVNLESDRAVLENRLEYLRTLGKDLNNSKQLKGIVVPSVYGITDPTLNTLVAQLSDQYSKREVLSFSVQEKAPSLILLDNQIKLTYNMLVQNINSLIVTTEADMRNLVRRVGGFSSQLSLLPRTEQQLSSLKRNFDLNNELYTFLLKMRAESAITYASNQPDVRILDPAQIETSKQTSPMTIINYLVGIIMGLLVPFGFIILSDLTNNSLQSKEEVEAMTKLSVLGMIIRNKSKKDLVVYENPRSNITESFRLLRTNLKFILHGKDKKVIAIQSTISGEGKSFIALNLASILAMNEYKVLLVGLDLRMSTLHKVFKSENKNGVSTYLSNHSRFNDIIVTTPISNLSYIPSGPVPPNPAELLENGNFELFMKEAKSRFDYVILDSAPISLVTDGIISGQYADINLFVIRLRYSSKEQIKIINDLDINTTLPNNYLVLNDAIKENFGNGNYYSYRNKGYYTE